MPRTAPHEEFTEGHRTLPAFVDPQTLRLDREFLLAHGPPKGPLTTVRVARDTSIGRHRYGVHLE